MIYDLYDQNRRWLKPWTIQAKAWADMLQDPQPNSFFNPSQWPGSREWAAWWELMHRVGKDYEKPDWKIHQVLIDQHMCPVAIQTELETPFCNLLRFKRYADDNENLREMKNDPTVLVVAPLSGHHASLLRDTVQTLLQDHKVYVTDWKDARMVPCEKGAFGLDDYVLLIEQFLNHLIQKTPNVHVFAVCQPVVPVLGAVARMHTHGQPVPKSMILMGGPVDARKSPTAPNNLATKHPYEWFEQHLIHQVPARHPGVGRKVYPGFLQYMGFVAMNPERHAMAHWDFYQNLLKGDLEDAETHRSFYDEYNAVLDMPAEYYLDTIKTVFQEFNLPQGTWKVQGEWVRPQDITQTALLTVEGERDDIAGQGQTKAAHALCTGLKPKQQSYFLAPGAGHYGLFSGRRWRDEIYPKLRDFIAKHQK